MLTEDNYVVGDFSEIQCRYFLNSYIEILSDALQPVPYEFPAYDVLYMEHLLEDPSLVSSEKFEKWLSLFLPHLSSFLNSSFKEGD